MRPLHWGQNVHFAAEVIANSLEEALLRVSRNTAKPGRTKSPQPP